MEEIFKKIFNELGYESKPQIIKSYQNVDFQCDDCFKIAKIYHKTPMEIGNQVVEKINSISNFSDYFKEVFFSNPGFINIKVSDKYINDQLKNLMAKDILGATKENKTIVIDYGGANVAKPLHVGHLRPAIIGQAINNILKFKGNKTISDVHLGDIGLQMGQVIYVLLHDFPHKKVEDINFDLDYLNEAYPKISTLCKENNNIKEECALITKKLQDGDERYMILWKKICDVSIPDIKKIYDYFDVTFDVWYSEYSASKYLKPLTEHLEKQGVVRIDEGAKIIDVLEPNDKVNIPPFFLEKSDGAFLYSSSDLATIYQREKDYHPDEILYVTDARQSMHFTQVFRAAKKGQVYNGKLEHYGHGTMNGIDNKPFKTRTGGVLKLEDLIKEVKEVFLNLREENKNMDREDIDKIVNAIIKFADLQNSLERNYIFDIQKFGEVNGKTGPYILYTYLRINKIIEKNESELSDNIYSETDRKLRLKILEVSKVINLASNERKPHLIADYLYDLCTSANDFYQNNRMDGLIGTKKNDLEVVLNFNNKIVKELLSLLGIDIPKIM